MNLVLPAFDQIRVLVVGDLMLDRYWTGPTARISPEAPVPVVRVDQIEDRPGGAANVAVNLASLGAKVTVAGLVGEDEAGAALARLLQARDIDCAFQAEPSVPTITKLRVLSRHQQLIRLDFEQDHRRVDTTPLQRRCREALAGVDALVLSDYGKGTLQDIPGYIEAARRAGVPVLVDPKGRNFQIYRGATLITPNLGEFEAVAGPCESDAELVEKGRAMRAELDLEALLITLSERGMLLIGGDDEAVHLPTRAREVYDVTGAGDTVISVLAAAIAAGQGFAPAAALANLAAGIVVGKLGTGAVSVPELRRAVREQSASWSAVLTREQLLEAVEESRAHGERVVMTNGCFDILHEGHIAYLEQARRLGDRLVVAVNDDDSVRRLKGEGRPINPLSRRMAVLAGLASVDWVVPFAEDTPRELICAVRPDVLVKGGDYRPEQIAGHDCVTAAGGEVIVLDYVEGASTTGIITRIRGTDD